MLYYKKYLLLVEKQNVNQSLLLSVSMTWYDHYPLFCLQVCGLIEHYKDPTCCMFFEPMLTIPLHRNFTFPLQHLCRAVITTRTTYDGINKLQLPKTLKSYLKEYHYKQRVRVRRLDTENDSHTDCRSISCLPIWIFSYYYSIEFYYTLHNYVSLSIFTVVTAVSNTSGTCIRYCVFHLTLVLASIICPCLISEE